MTGIITVALMWPTLEWQWRFFSPLSYYTWYKRYGTERISHNANHTLPRIVSKGTPSLRRVRLSQGEGHRAPPQPALSLSTSRRPGQWQAWPPVTVQWLLDNPGPTRSIMFLFYYFNIITINCYYDWLERCYMILTREVIWWDADVSKIIESVVWKIN